MQSFLFVHTDVSVEVVLKLLDFDAYNEYKFLDEIGLLLQASKLRKINTFKLKKLPFEAIKSCQKLCILLCILLLLYLNFILSIFFQFIN